ncbi:MAG TPA: class I SAM-dependent methyltransferase [Sedimenticola sp.]|nr:class I SAM-dependent methyltransferase [Sedimenticola sp.]
MSDHPPVIEQDCPVCGGNGRFAYMGKDLLMGLPGEYCYAECASCGAVYQAPTPSSGTIASFYPDDYEPYRAGGTKELNPLEKSVLRARYGYRHLSGGLPDWLGQLAATFAYRDAIPYRENGRLLDVGCGGGKFLLAMRKLGWRPEGVEFNESAARTCRESGLEVFRGELAEAAFPDESFDVVTARHVIEHIPDPRPFIAEIFRILKPGGLMVLKTPNSQALGRGWFGANWYANDVPRHLILFAPNNLRLLATRAGFREKTTETFSTPKMVLNSWDYRTGNRGRPSKKRKLRRIIARLYVLAAALSGHGDEIFCIYQKPRRP